MQLVRLSQNPRTRKSPRLEFNSATITEVYSMSVVFFAFLPMSRYGLMSGLSRTFQGWNPTQARQPIEFWLSSCRECIKLPSFHARTCVLVNKLLHPSQWDGESKIPNSYQSLDLSLNSTAESTVSQALLGVVSNQVPVPFSWSYSRRWVLFLVNPLRIFF